MEKNASIRPLRDATDVIIPTYDNVEQLSQCVGSILQTNWMQRVNVIVINNGSAPLESMMGGIPRVKVVTPGDNLGWEGGLKEGLRHSSSKYVVFSNDDIYIPRSEHGWLRRMIRDLELSDKIGAVGPSTNVAMGRQNIWIPPYHESIFVPFLIGFCVVVRRSALEEVGGVDDTLPGGDDIDLSIRLRSAGYSLVVRKDVFVFHHGFQTGVRIHGGPDRPNGWNSPQMTENTNMALIRKHGFMKWYDTIMTQSVAIDADASCREIEDAEGSIVKSYLKPGTILELGCGAKKTVDHSIGIDIVPQGEIVDCMENKSVADLCADVQLPLPINGTRFDNVIARHVLEHLVDPVAALRNWKCALNDGGRMVIAVPDERLGDTIPMNPEHLHAFTASSLKTLGEAVGLRALDSAEYYNGIGVVVSFEVA